MPDQLVTVRGIALDMDGLLFDTERLFFDVGDQVLIPRGHRFSAELQSRMMGRVGVAAMQEMIDFHGLNETAETLLEESDRLYLQALGDRPTAMPGLEEWINRLVQSGLPFGIATSSRRMFVDRIMTHVAWRDQLHFILTGDDVTHGKPHPEIYVSAAEKMSIPPEEMLVLEDSANGTAAAVAAGAVTVSVPSEHTQKHDFSGAIFVAESLRDPRLARIIERSAPDSL